MFPEDSFGGDHGDGGGRQGSASGAGGRTGWDGRSCDFSSSPGVTRGERASSRGPTRTRGNAGGCRRRPPYRAFASLARRPARQLPDDIGLIGRPRRGDPGKCAADPCAGADDMEQRSGGQQLVHGGQLVCRRAECRRHGETDDRPVPRSVQHRCRRWRRIERRHRQWQHPHRHRCGLDPRRHGHDAGRHHRRRVAVQRAEWRSCDGRSFERQQWRDRLGGDRRRQRRLEIERHERDHRRKWCRLADSPGWRHPRCQRWCWHALHRVDRQWNAQHRRVGPDSGHDQRREDRSRHAGIDSQFPEQQRFGFHDADHWRRRRGRQRARWRRLLQRQHLHWRHDDQRRIPPAEWRRGAFRYWRGRRQCGLSAGAGERDRRLDCRGRRQHAHHPERFRLHGRRQQHLYNV